MTKLKLSSKSLVRRALLFSFFSFLTLLLGCTSSTEPTYSKEKIDSNIIDICKKEYKLDVTVKLFGETLWVYLPVDEIFTQAKKPKKIRKIFDITKVEDKFSDHILKLDYAIKSITPKEEDDFLEVNKDASEKVNNAWKAIRRVIFSLGQKENDVPKFCCVVTADIKSGFEIRSICFIPDLKKVSYSLISFEEYQHRSVQETNVNPSIVADKNGSHLKYTDITMEEFIAAQIQQRVKLRFEKEELEKNADIAKEILKIVVYTIKTYNFKDFNKVEIRDELSGYNLILNRAAVWARLTE